MQLTEELLESIRARAAHYDETNSFFHEDLDALRQVDYLHPRPLTQLVRDQRTLARFAPATALGLGMHFTWVGVAHTLQAHGDDSLNFVLEGARSGEVFAFGVSERGNDRVLTDSVTRVSEVEGGYAFHGEKIFTSLSPAWTQLALLGRMGESIVHGFISRSDPGFHIVEDWNTLGMRATQSHTTVLDGAVVTPERLTRILPAGDQTDPFIRAIFQNFLLLVSSVYVGIAERALELATEAVSSRTSMAREGKTYASDPDIRWQVADAAMAVDALDAPLRTLAADVVDQVDHGPRWFRLLSGVKHRSVETARSVVDSALRLHGGRGYHAGHEMSRLQRDVLAGVYHPSDTEAVHHTVAFDLLGPAERQ
ncbi:acyl-CoA dehydrogenase family protein [Pontimonas sp.]|jgi:alkylation response protein AidB-like acyl-CoA dehydrogenase|uniref:acyl-CoA dehydrogenase family protein n=1 Tax=Pontimonas sp. TaxID=2304492 RepID=UPI0028708C4B|nr:acyl-CoA dehydrogenase family protein [Pontimonas sp.]MDR9396539.1 acyl-CoA dehydrogenase family protein [Pontimonas sp.]MDR9434158.1 acyl-CoA dehydrogenase family protein [Pontimonas sp.]